MDDLFAPTSPAVEDEGEGSSGAVEPSTSTHHPSSGDASAMSRLRCVPIERLRAPVDEEPAVTQTFIEDVLWDTSQIDWSELSASSEDESSSAPSDVLTQNVSPEEDGIWFYTPYSHKWYADPI